MRKIRCSHFPRYYLCPASTAEHINIENNNDYASAGTELHRHVKEYIESGVKGDFGFQFWRAVDFIKQYAGAKIEAEVKMSDVYRDITIEGTADCIIKTESGEVIIIDWKTFPANMSDYYPQLCGYAALYHHYTSEQNIFIGLANLTDNEIEIKKVSIEEIKNIVDTVIDNTSSPDKYNPSSFGCSYCPSRNACPAIKQIMLEIAGNAEITPENVAINWDRLQLLERIIEAAKERFKLFVELEGKYETANGSFEIINEERNKIDAHKAFKSLTTQYGLDIALDAVSINQTGLKELAKQIPAKKLKDAINEVNAVVKQSGAVAKTIVKKLKYSKKEKL